MLQKYNEFKSNNDFETDDIDENVRVTLCEWDDEFPDDEKWFNEEGNDLKDELRDQVLEMLGHEV